MRSVTVIICSTDLPGLDCADRSGVRVGIQVGRVPTDLVPGDSAVAQWLTEVEVTDSGDFRGPAVQGKKGERFIYLVWLSDEQPAMFGRVKVMLDEHADLSGTTATATVSLTDERGRPRCARLKPPAISWS